MKFRTDWSFEGNKMDIQTLIDRIQDITGKSNYPLYLYLETISNEILLVGNDGDNTMRMSRCKNSHHFTSIEKALDYILIRETKESNANRCVHAKTKEEWDFVTKKIGFPIKFERDSVIYFDSREYSSIDYAKSNNYPIITFEEWCREFDHWEEWRATGNDKTYEIGQNLQRNPSNQDWKFILDSSNYSPVCDPINFDELRLYGANRLRKYPMSPNESHRIEMPFLKDRLDELDKKQINWLKEENSKIIIKTKKKKSRKVKDVELIDDNLNLKIKTR